MMMPRLEAGEHLAALRVQGLAMGGYAREDAEEMLRELRERVSGGDTSQPKAKKATPDQLRALGIGVIMPKGDGDA